MITIFSKYRFLAMLFCVVVVETLLFTSIPAQTRTVYTFDDRDETPSYKAMKDRLDQISEDTLGKYKDALRSNDDEKAKQLLDEIGKDLILTYSLPSKRDALLRSGWSEKDWEELPKLTKKMKDIHKRLGKIQASLTRTAHTGSLFF